MQSTGVGPTQHLPCVRLNTGVIIPVGQILSSPVSSEAIHRSVQQQSSRDGERLQINSAPSAELGCCQLRKPICICVFCASQLQTAQTRVMAPKLHVGQDTLPIMSCFAVHHCRGPCKWCLTMAPSLQTHLCSTALCVQTSKDSSSEETARGKCHGCLMNLMASAQADQEPGVVLQCSLCRHLFCFDCDVYIHESLHNCPGCESSTQRQEQDGSDDDIAMMDE